MPAEKLRSGMRVYVGGSSNEPGGLLDAIAAAPECAAGVTFVQFPLAGLNNRDLSALHPDTRSNVISWHRNSPTACRRSAYIPADADASGVRPYRGAGFRRIAAGGL
jgi:hypothetical protein